MCLYIYSNCLKIYHSKFLFLFSLKKPINPASSPEFLFKLTTMSMEADLCPCHHRWELQDTVVAHSVPVSPMVCCVATPPPRLF